MILAPHIDQLRQQLANAAETGGPEAIAVAERLAAALDAAARLVLLDVLSEAAGEITRDLAPGSVDLRLRGREPEFVVTLARETNVSRPEAPRSEAPRAEPARGDDDESGSTRTTLRLPDQLKARVEEAAGRAGISVNAWLVRAVASALQPKARSDSGGGETFTGWVR
jgi:hypothetical protein